MIYFHSIQEGLPIFKALGSQLRINIINILLRDESKSLNEIATELNISNGALSTHIKKLEECGLISVSKEGAEGHGNIKICKLLDNKMLVEFNRPCSLNNVLQTHIKVGHYREHEVYPTCGLASATSLIGEVDDNRFFDHPDRFDADILWFTKGYITYEIPNFVPPQQKIDQISLSFEIGSEAPGFNDNWPSDIYFQLNGVPIGKWLSPGDFGSTKAFLSPSWWYNEWNQYGLLKLLVINQKGTFIDGTKISDTTLDQFNLQYKSRICITFSVPEDAEHVGGLTLYGKSFGNYRQDINVQIHYRSIE